MLFGFGKPSPSAIRPLRADKAEDCARLHAAAFAHAWSAAEIAQMLKSAATVGAAALDPASGKLRGFVLSRLAADEAEILTVAVDSALRGKGIGRALIAQHLRQVANAGARTVFLEVDKDNRAALALYARFGFVAVGERPGYYRRPGGAPATAVIMRRDVK